MGAYKFLGEIDKNRVFVVNRSDLEGRFEPEYYKPSISNMENIVRLKAEKKLNDYIKGISSGATPSITEEDKYYSDPENGIPFLRVQNLQTNGKLNLKDLKYINKETHENYLKRSQVYEGDLLVKITGVGRMAIASVAPANFVGNTNQHMVVIKTKDKSISEYLASYLNLDIIEKLASRRSTGATRPALDYPALKSIPVIENIDFSIIVETERLKQQKEQEAQTLLEGIDGYLLHELGITLPEQDNNLQSRIFTADFSEITGGRFDPDFYKLYYSNFLKQLDKKYSKEKLKDLTRDIFQGVGRDLVNFSEFTLLKVKNIIKGNEIDYKDVEYVKSVPDKKILRYNDIISPFIGEAIKQIKFSIFKGEENAYAVDNNTGVIRIKEGYNPEYICNVLNSKIGEIQIFRLIGGGGVPFLGAHNVKEIFIPIPAVEKQNEIANKISEIRAKAKQLKEEAKTLLENAKKEVEQLILGKI